MTRRDFLGRLFGTAAVVGFETTFGIRRAVIAPMRVATYDELAIITRKAFLPRLYVQAYTTPPFVTLAQNRDWWEK